MLASLFCRDAVIRLRMRYQAAVFAVEIGRPSNTRSPTRTCTFPLSSALTNAPWIETQLPTVIVLNI